MSAFEDFVNLELPKRPPMLTLANTGYDNDPNLGGAPAVVQNSPAGTFFFRNTGYILYLKDASAPGTWTVVGSGGAANAVTKTTAPLTLYVAPTGLDTNPGTLLLPFLTIQAALDAVPKLLQHLVTINVAAGNYAGYRVEGFSVAALVAGDFAGLSMLGTFGTFVPATGSSTGAVTSSTTAQFTTSPCTFTEITDTSQALTVNDLRGQYILFTSGAQNGTMLPIVSNTATGITVQSTQAIATASAYSIKEPLSVITSSVRQDPTIQTSTQITVNTGLLAGAHYINNVSSRGSGAFRLEGFKFAVTTPSTVFHINAQSMDNFTVARCTFINAQSGFSSMLNAQGEGAVTQTQCYMNGSISGIGVNASTGVNLTVTNCLLVSTSAIVAMNIGTVYPLLISQCTIDGGAFGVTCTPQSPSAMSVSNTKIFNTSSQAFRVRNAASSCDLTMTGVDIGVLDPLNPTGGSSSTGFELLGFHSATITRLFVTNYLFQLAQAFGSRMQIDALSTFSGGQGLLFDGTITTLEAMRNAPGKVLIGPYGSTLHE